VASLDPFLIFALVRGHFNTEKNIVQQVYFSLNGICCRYRSELKWPIFTGASSDKTDRVNSLALGHTNGLTRYGDIHDSAASYSRIVCYTIQDLGRSMYRLGSGLLLIDIKIPISGACAYQW
jgi:hypothetical protein